jgi:hypothetical protein
MGGMLGSIGADDDLQQIIEAGDGDVLQHGFAVREHDEPGPMAARAPVPLDEGRDEPAGQLEHSAQVHNDGADAREPQCADSTLEVSTAGEGLPRATMIQSVGPARP